MFTHFEEEGIHAFFQSGIDGEKLLHDGSGDSLRGGVSESSIVSIHCASARLHIAKQIKQVNILRKRRD